MPPRTLPTNRARKLALVVFAVTGALVSAAGSAQPPRQAERGERAEGGEGGRERASAELALGPIPGDAYRCRQPEIEVPRDSACERGEPYPACRWQIPANAGREAGERFYRIWRNTTPEHRWGRPGLVSHLLAVAVEHARRWPGRTLGIGDLDAPGPRHQTHRNGQDVDLYLEHAMMARSIGRRRYPSNYEGRSPAEVAAMRAEVMDLARNIATCAQGQIRIYYNDGPLVRAFRRWFEAQSLRTPFRHPMRRHNALHRFHFHLTLAEDLAPLPTEPLSESLSRSEAPSAD